MNATRWTARLWAWVAGCHHRYGTHGTTCIVCGHGERRHPFAGEPVRYHRTQAGGQPLVETGIERERRRQAEADRETAREMGVRL